MNGDRHGIISIRAWSCSMISGVVVSVSQTVKSGECVSRDAANFCADELDRWIAAK